MKERMDELNRLKTTAIELGFKKTRIEKVTLEQEYIIKGALTLEKHKDRLEALNGFSNQVKIEKILEYSSNKQNYYRALSIERLNLTPEQASENKFTNDSYYFLMIIKILHKKFNKKFEVDYWFEESLSINSQEEANNKLKEHKEKFEEEIKEKIKSNRIGEIFSQASKDLNSNFNQTRDKDGKIVQFPPELFKYIFCMFNKRYHNKNNLKNNEQAFEKGYYENQNR